jgi:DNA-binding transcriptional LysR family regulator
MKFRSFDSFRVFEKVAKLESITFAAEELNLSKGTISYQISKLENELGFLLFDRVNSRLVLTTKGRRLWYVAESSLNQIEREINLLRGANSGTVRVGIVTTFASRWLSARLTKFFEACPDLSLKIESINSIDEFQDANFSLAILWGDTWSTFEHELLMSTSSFVMSNEEIYKQTSKLDLRMIMKTIPLMNDGFYGGHGGMQAWHRAADIGYEPSKNSLKITDSFTRLQAVIDGQGIALWDELVNEEIDEGKLFYISDIKLEGFGYHLVYKNKSSLSFEEQQFRKWIMKELEG